MNGPARIWNYLARESIWLPIIAVFGISVLLVSPRGEFPLNDDWIHARVVRDLVEHGHYEHHPYLTATFVAQAYWGALFTWLFGFSFTVLRLSTLVLAVVGGWAVARAAMALGLPRGLALLCGILCCANPLMMNLAYSFMTDVPFLAACSLAGCCFLIYLRDPRSRWLALCSACSVAAFLTRQTGVVMPAAVGIVLVTLQLRGQLPLRRSAIVAFVVPWVLGAGAYFWLASVREHSTPMLLGARSLLKEGVEGARYFPILFAYLGLLSLPLIAVLPWKQLSRRARLWFLGFAGSCAALFVLPRVVSLAGQLIRGRRVLWLDEYAIRMPLVDTDYIRDLAVSFPHLPGQTPHPPVAIGDLWWILTAASVVVAGFFFLGALRAWGPPRPADAEEPEPVNGAARLFLVVWFLLAALSMLNPWRGVGVCDRYFLPCLAPFVLLLGLEARHTCARKAFAGAAVGTLLFWGFGLVCLQDYMAWNRTVWEAQNKLVSTHGVTPDRIRGEDTFQGWHNSEEYMRRFKTRNFWEANRTKLGPWTFDDEYVVTAADTLAGYSPFERFTYRTWLGMGERHITIFRRDNSRTR